MPAVAPFGPLLALLAACAFFASQTDRFLTDFDKVGRGLTSAAGAYDSAVGSMERRLLPQLRKVEGLGIAPGKAIEPPEPTEITVRAITAPELSESETPALD